MKVRNVLVGFVAMLPLLSVPIPAHAGVIRLPLRCGMVVSQDAYVYLEKNLYCRSDFGVRVEDPNPADDYYPLVTVDLQGYTLRGGTAVSGIAPHPAEAQVNLRVINGRVENWAEGVRGAREVTLRNVKFVDNWRGVVCGDYEPGKDEEAGAFATDTSRCDLDFVYVARNTTGLIARGTALVRHSRFWGNTYGAMLEWSALLEQTNFVNNRPAGVFAAALPDAPVKIRYSRFIDNSDGVEAARGGLLISHSLFASNRYFGVFSYQGGKISDSTFKDHPYIAIAPAGNVEPEPGQPCVELHRVRFIRNATNTGGNVC